MSSSNVVPAAAAFGVLIALLPGCTGYKDPLVTVKSVHLTDMTEEAAQATFTLELTNPNDEPLELRDFSYTVAAEGRTIFQGRRAAQAVLNRKGTRELSLPAPLLFDALGFTAASHPAQINCTITGSLEYLAPGSIAELLFDAGVSTPDIAFSGGGTVDLTAPRPATQPATSPTTRP